MKHRREGSSFILTAGVKEAVNSNALRRVKHPKDSETSQFDKTMVEEGILYSSNHDRLAKDFRISELVHIVVLFGCDREIWSVDIPGTPKASNHGIAGCVTKRGSTL
jgi:hypothetical protein